SFLPYRSPDHPRSLDHPMISLRHYRGLDRLIHLVIARTTAQVPAQRVPYIFFRRIRIAVEQRFHRDHEPRRAVAALCSAPVAIGFLDGRQRAVISNTFHRRYLRRDWPVG